MASKSLVRMLTLLLKYSIEHPRSCRYSNSKILDFVLNILEFSTDYRIQDLGLEWGIRIATNHLSKQYLLNNRIMVILSQTQFKSIIDNVENILSVLFDYDKIKITQKIIKELYDLVMFHSHIFTNW